MITPQKKAAGGGSPWPGNLPSKSPQQRNRKRRKERRARELLIFLWIFCFAALRVGGFHALGYPPGLLRMS